VPDGNPAERREKIEGAWTPRAGIVPEAAEECPKVSLYRQGLADDPKAEILSPPLGRPPRFELRDHFMQTHAAWATPLISKVRLCVNDGGGPNGLRSPLARASTRNSEGSMRGL